MFTRDNLLASDWYADRLAEKQRHDIKLWHANATYLQRFLEKEHYKDEAERLGIRARLDNAWDTYHAMKLPEYLTKLNGTIGLQPLKV